MVLFFFIRNFSVKGPDAVLTMLKFLERKLSGKDFSQSQPHIHQLKLPDTKHFHPRKPAFQLKGTIVISHFHFQIS